MKTKIKSFLLNNKIFTLILIGEVLVVAWLILGLFSAPFIRSINPSDLLANASPDYARTLNGNDFNIESLSQASEMKISSANTYGISSGAYIVNVEYNSHSLIGNDQKLINNKTGEMWFSSDNSELSVKMDRAVLDDTHNTVQTRMWISQGANISDLKLNLKFNGIGNLTITSITLEEQPIYRFVVLIVTLLSFGLINFIFLILFCDDFNFDLKKFKVPTFLLLIIIFSSLPLFVSFVYFGWDIYFHLERIAMVANEMSNGVFPVRMMTDMLGGYSYPNSIFYCDIFLYIPAILYNCMLPLQTAGKIYLFMVNAATCLISYYCFKRMTKSENISILGSILFVLGAERLIYVYNTFAIGTITATIFVPLVVLGIYSIYTKSKITYRDWLPLALGMAGMIQSHILSTELAVVFLLIFVFICLGKTFKKEVLLALSKAVALCTLLSVWFIVPFLDYFLRVPVQVSTMEPNKPQLFGTYLIQLFGAYTVTHTNKPHIATLSERSLSIGLALVIGLILIVFCVVNRKKWKEENSFNMISLKVLLELSIITMIFSMTHFPWDNIINLSGSTIGRIIGSVQFSFRYIQFASCFLAIGTIIALLIVSKHDYELYKKVFVTLLLSSLISTSVYFVQFADTSRFDYVFSESHEDSMYVGAGEYLPQDTGWYELYESNVLQDGEKITPTEYEKIGSKTYLTYTNTSANEVKITIPILNYLNYHVYDVATNEEYDIINGENNNIAFMVKPNFSGQFVVQYEVPIYWRIAEIISLITLISLCAYLLLDKRNKKLTLEIKGEK